MKIKTKIYAILATIFCLSIFNSAAAFQSGEVQIGGVGDLSNSEIQIDSIGGGSLGWGGHFLTGENSENVEPENSTTGGSMTTGGQTGSFVRDEDGNLVSENLEEEAEETETTDEEVIAETTEDESEENSTAETENSEPAAEEEIPAEVEEAEEENLPAEKTEEEIPEPEKTDEPAEKIVAEESKIEKPKAAAPKFVPQKIAPPQTSEPEIVEEIVAADEPQKPAAGFSWKAFLIFAESFVLLWLALFFAIAAIDRGWLRKIPRIRRTKNLRKKS